ncbi:hypothetical protein B0H16DRAFT_1735743 [Mycena metata]|uniref:Uncharacterized protein n=1 Tax=Mycena metata TaxID=1033252 RepID=A0AAD7MNZ3_9AGAR|nr:hypothetical protein B0H16DRAFT_1735743 [Mycena metata]
MSPYPTHRCLDAANRPAPRPTEEEDPARAQAPLGSTNVHSPTHRAGSPPTNAHSSIPETPHPHPHLGAGSLHTRTRTNSPGHAEADTQKPPPDAATPTHISLRAPPPSSLPAPRTNAGRGGRNDDNTPASHAHTRLCATKGRGRLRCFNAETPHACASQNLPTSSLSTKKKNPKASARTHILHIAPIPRHQVRAADHHPYPPPSTSTSTQCIPTKVGFVE